MICDGSKIKMLTQFGCELLRSVWPGKPLLVVAFRIAFAPCPVMTVRRVNM